MRHKQLIAYLGCAVGIGVFSGFNNFALTLWLRGFTSSYLLLSLMGNTRSFEGTLVAPAVGVWSDHVWLGWLGRRRPFILTGGLLSALLLALTPAFTHIPLLPGLGWLPKTAPGLIQAIAIIFLFTLAFNAMADIHEALLVDVTTDADRNRVSALRTVVSIASQVAILVLGFFIWRHGIPSSAFALTGGLMAFGILVTVALVREPSPAAWAADRGIAMEARKLRLSPWMAIRQYRGAAIFCLAFFFFWSGVNAVLPLLSIYVQDILHASTGEALILPAILLASTAALALPMAKLGSRYGKRRVIAAGYAIVALVGLSGLKITTIEQGALVFVLAGTGNAAVQVLTVPLLADLVPRRHIGAATGILAGSGSVSAPVASLIAGSLSDVYGPRVIFLLMAICVGAAMLLIPFVRPLLIPGSGEDAALAPAAPGAENASEVAPEIGGASV